MVLEGIGILFLLAGLFFFAVGTLGLLRLPDLYSRMHAVTKSDTLGVSLILAGLILFRGMDVVSLRLILIVGFIWITNPTAAHAIARAAYDTHEVGRENIPLWDLRGGEKVDRNT